MLVTTPLGRQSKMHSRSLRTGCIMKNVRAAVVEFATYFLALGGDKRSWAVDTSLSGYPFALLRASLLASKSCRRKIEQCRINQPACDAGAVRSIFFYDTSSLGKSDSKYRDTCCPAR